MIRNASLVLFLYCFPLLIWGQGTVTFTASADAKQVVLGGYFEVSFTLSNANGGNFQAPSFKDFNVLGGPSQSISTTSINGQWSRTLTYSYTLQPKRVGNFAIGPATIEVKGKRLKSRSIKIGVVKGKNSNATTQEDLVGQLEDQIFIKVEPQTLDAYVGQQVLVDYKIYTTREVESYNLLEESDYPGFYAQDVRRYNARVIREVIDGVQYSTKVLKRVALFPQQAGILDIEPMKMQVAIVAEQQPRRRSFFSTPNLTRLQLKTE
ncbi:MAG: BatD family protein, partial [Bacteroidota bacterium]